MIRLFYLLWIFTAVGAVAQNPRSVPQPSVPQPSASQLNKNEGQTSPSLQDLFPFVIPWNDSSPSVVSQSDRLARTFASGPLAIDDNGHFKNDSGRVRFWGATVSAGACFPSHHEAEEVARHLAKMGINCVRFSAYDEASVPEGIWTTWESDRTLSTEQLDRFDYFFAKLKENGIYLCIDLASHRPWKPGTDLTPGLSAIKESSARSLMAIFDPTMLELQQRFLREFLGRVNTYTGILYNQEPALAFFEIEAPAILQAEKSGQLKALPGEYLRIIQTQWERWQSQNPVKASGTSDSKKIWRDFLTDYEQRFWKKRREFLQKELGFQSLIIGSSKHDLLTIDVLSETGGWRLPVFPKLGTDATDWYVLNDAMVNHPQDPTILSLSKKLPKDIKKPRFLTEYKHPAANTFEAEAFFVVTALTLLADWDGIFPYAYNSSWRKWDLRRIPGYYDIDQNPVKSIAQMMCSLAFRRGDISPLVAQGTEPSNALGNSDGAKKTRTIPARTPTKPGKAKKAPLPQVQWSLNRKDKGLLVVETAYSHWIVGFGEGQTSKIGAITYLPGASLQEGFSVISLTALDDKPIGQSRRLLLAILGAQDNTGLVNLSSTIPDTISASSWWIYPDRPAMFPPPEGQKVTKKDQWGRPPSLVEAPRAVILYPAKPSKVHVWALGPRGERQLEVKVEKAPEGKAKIELSSVYKTLWYEINLSP